jgi:hypothetical protein
VYEIPKGPTGKIQRTGQAGRLGLTENSGRRTPADGAFVRPATDLERLRAEIWCTALRLPSVSVHQRFLDASGDSIPTTRLVDRVRQRFNIDWTLLNFSDALTGTEQAVIFEGLLLDEIEALSDDRAGQPAPGAAKGDDL